MTARIRPDFPTLRAHIESWKRTRESDRKSVRDDTRVIRKLEKSLALLERKYSK